MDHKFNYNLIFILIVGVFIGIISNIIAKFNYVLMISILFIILLIFPVFLYRKFDLFAPTNAIIFPLLIFYPISIFYLFTTTSFERVGRITFTNPDEAMYLISLALIYISLGFIFFCLGYYINIGDLLAKKIPFFGQEWKQKKLFHIILIYTLLGIISWYIYLEQSGGVVYYITHLAQRWNLAYETSKYFRWGGELFPIASLLWLAYYFRWGGSKIVFLHLLLGSLLLFSFGSRGAVILVWIAVFILYYYISKENFFRKVYKFFIFSISVISFIFITTIYRYSTRGGFEYQKLFVSGLNPLQSLIEGRYGGLEVFILFLKYVPEKLNFQYGETFVNIIFFPIPRNIWADKPVGLGRTVAETFFPGMGGGPAVPFIAELYLNFHVVGIVIGMMLVGIFARTVYSYLRDNLENIGTILIYAISFLYIFTGGDFIHTTIRYLERLIPILIGVFYISGGKLKIKKNT